GHLLYCCDLEFFVISFTSHLGLLFKYIVTLKSV
ncbi:MAG: hypothetical protein ACJAYO_002151, partial [Thalassolituus oleivorans]